MKLEEANQSAWRQALKYKRGTAVVMFENETGAQRFKVYFYSRTEQALKDCKAGERIELQCRYTRHGFLVKPPTGTGAHR